MTLPAAFWTKTAPATNCIVWRGAQNSKGYGCFAVNGVSQLAHRVAWEDVHGPIPDDMTIDHLCRVHACVNVDHMEFVSIAENIRRQPRVLRVGGECRNGHSIAADADMYVNRRKGTKECRECRRAAKQRADVEKLARERRAA
jgi:hypothetical protein